MASKLILPRFHIWKQCFGERFQRERPDLGYWMAHPNRLPQFVRESPVAQRYLELLGQIDWAAFPERNLETDWGKPAIPYTTFAAACLIKLDQGQVYMSRLRKYLAEHPALVWMLGFPLVDDPRCTYGFDVDASLPTARHLT